MEIKLIILTKVSNMIKSPIAGFNSVNLLYDKFKCRKFSKLYKFLFIFIKLLCEIFNFFNFTSDDNSFGNFSIKLS